MPVVRKVMDEHYRPQSPERGLSKILPQTFTVPVVDQKVHIFDQEFSLPTNYPPATEVTVEIHGQDVYVHRDESLADVSRLFQLNREGEKDIYGVVVPDDSGRSRVTYLLNLLDQPVRMDLCPPELVDVTIEMFQQWYTRDPAGLRRAAEDLTS